MERNYPAIVVKRFSSIFVVFFFVCIVGSFSYHSFAIENNPWILPGSIQTTSSAINVCVFSGNDAIFRSADTSMQVEVIQSIEPCTMKNDIPGVVQIQTPIHQSVVVQIQSKFPIQFQYQNPHLAFKDFAVMFKELAIPWQRRIYIEDYLSPIEGNQMKYPPNMFHISDLVDFGAPYTWGGKESLQSISVKLNKNNSVFDRIPDHFQDMITHKSVMHPVNLDEGESIWDRPRGMESPAYWTGVDCSGLLEQCSYYSGLQWNWRTATVIASGDYRGAFSFDQVLPGDVMVLKRSGIVVHFGVISQKGVSIPTTSIIHSAWFTNYQYNTNTLQKVIETSLSEFRSVYTWDIVRLSLIE